MKTLKKAVRIIVIILTVLCVVLYISFVYFSTPKSDKAVLKSFKSSPLAPQLTTESFRGFNYRKIKIGQDSTLPRLLFIHGTIGSLSDFSRYMSDSLLQTKVNMIAYERIGYGKNNYPTQESIMFERAMVLDILKNEDLKNTILLGYSYGGPIALSVKQNVKKIFLLAPAVYSETEKTPWMINFYNCKATRWLVPKIWQEASKEKLSHKNDLRHFEQHWQNTPNTIVCIQGTKDWIVPFENSLLLQKNFFDNNFKLIEIKEAGHGLVWSNFDVIKQHILNNLD